MAQSQHDVEGFLVRLNGESPRARILLEAGLLEELLRAAILKRLATNKSSEELFGKGSVLGMTTLTKYAHALGLIGDKELDAMKKFAKARNLIAHAWQQDFNQLPMQKIANSIQLISIVGEADMDAHQRCFAKLDYVGIYLIEELVERFSRIPPTIFDGAVFITNLIVDPKSGSRIKTVVATQ